MKRNLPPPEVNSRFAIPLVVALLMFWVTLAGPRALAGPIQDLALIPAGAFEMGDHQGFVDPKHGGDETPIHKVRLDAFYMGVHDVTTKQYCDFLNATLAQGMIEVRNGGVYQKGSGDLLCETRNMSPYSRVGFSGAQFTVLDKKESHPVVCIRWSGAAAYCNWLNAENKLPARYNPTTWACDFNKSGYRLPTEAEWEYAARGGQQSPYYNFPWGDAPDPAKANWPESDNPFRAGPQPWTTPVGFFNGQLHNRADFGWPGPQESFQTANGINGYGLYDMSGNVWQFVNDWYGRDYYAYSPSENPPGPDQGNIMPDGKPYRGMRGGNWYNGENGHGRVANRNPGYYRGPGDPNGPWFHIGFRVVRNGASPVASGASPEQLGDGFLFTEGPAADDSGDVFFSDVDASKIYHWSATNGSITTFSTNSGGANGLYFDDAGNLLACEGTNKRLTSITPAGTVTALATQYNSAAFNKPNDLWIAPNGGVYFSDPLFGAGTQTQAGEYVYYLSPDYTTVTLAISDMTRPNGLIGTPDGTTLYAADYGASKVYKYTINANGTLSGKTLFASVQCDGMTIDDEGNIYMAENDVLIYSPAGNLIGRIDIPEIPTNMTFGGIDGHTLFITARTAIYTIRMTSGRPGVSATVSTPPVISGTIHTPASPKADQTVWVTASITDDQSVSSATLTYDSSAAKSAKAGAETTVFSETMAGTAVKPWTGAGCDNAWTVTGTFCEQRTGSNYGAGNVCGMEFKGGTVNLTDAMVETTQAINAQGSSGYVEFWIKTDTLTGVAGWTFQLDSGSGYTTRLSELTGSTHVWQQYHYDLLPAERVAGLKMRFQFQGGGTEHRIDLDQISVITTTASTSVQLPMADDGLHGDGTAGDHIFGAQIPALPAGTTVDYYITAVDNEANQVTDPATAPTNTYSYTVAAAAVTQTVGLFTNLAGAYPGYTLMAPMHYTRTYLINNAGLVVHYWDSEYEPGRTCYLMEDGHMFRAGMVMSGGPSTGGGEGGRIEEFDWAGNLIWSIDFLSSNYIGHHDFKVLPNGNIILLVAEKKTYAEVIAAGFDPSLLDPQISTSGYMLPDYVAEIEPTFPSGGNVVWEWHTWDHMIQDFDAAKNNYGVVASHPELVDVNGTGIKIPQFWNHMNSIGYNADLDQIILSARGNSELWVIDHQTTTAQAASHAGGRYSKGGDLLYRWGNPQQYGAGTNANQMLLQQHDTEWIPAGCPGAGHMLVYNNGIGRNYSSIDEIAPPVDAAGNYALTAGAAYAPSSLYWTYSAPTPGDFYSAEISGAQRLPNGNTLVCEGLKGNLFEVTQTGQMVWRYLCPVVLDGPMTQGETVPEDPRGGYMNAVFQVMRYPLTYPGLLGKDLTPQGTIEIYNGETLSVDFTATPSWGKPPLSVNFTGTATGAQQIVNWRWDFGDGTILEGNEPNPAHIYTDEGTYTVTLTVTSGTDSTMLTRKDYIFVSQAMGVESVTSLIMLAMTFMGAGSLLIARRRVMITMKG